MVSPDWFNFFSLVCVSICLVSAVDLELLKKICNYSDKECIVKAHELASKADPSFAKMLEPYLNRDDKDMVRLVRTWIEKGADFTKMALEMSFPLSQSWLKEYSEYDEYT